MLGDITVSCYPHMKQQKQEKIHRALHKKAYPDTYARSLTPAQVAHLLKAGKI
jgi:hypothetical protein